MGREPVLCGVCVCTFWSVGPGASFQDEPSCGLVRPGQASFRIGLLVTFSRVNGSLVRLEGKGVAWISCLCCPLSGRCLGCIRVCTGALKLDSVRYWVLFVKRFSRVARVCQFGLCAMYPSVLPYGSGCLVYVRVPVCMGRVVYSNPHAGRAPKSSHVFVVARTLMLHV